MKLPSSTSKSAPGRTACCAAWTPSCPPTCPRLSPPSPANIADLSATQDNLADSLAALPNLTDTVRYGDVRALDPAPLLAVLDTLLARLAAGGVQGCLNIDHDSASALFTPIRQADYQLSLLANDGIFAAIPAVGFALLFNVPPRALKFCAALGALGHGTATLLKLAQVTPVFATFFAAALVGSLGVWLAQRYHRAHPKVFTVAAVIPMFPGIPAYRAMLSLVLIEKEGYSPERFAVMVDQFVQTGFLLAALVFGLALPGLLFYRQKPVV